MKWFNCSQMVIVFAGFVTVSVLGGGPAKADFTFGEPTNLGPPIWSLAHDPQGCCFSRDGLELYFASDRPGGLGDFDIWVATRETVDAPWGEPVNLGPNVNSHKREIAPAISPDGLELYFTLHHNYNIRVCSRPSKDAPWSNSELLGPPVALSHQDYEPEVSADGLSLYFASRRPGGYGGEDIWVSTRATTSDSWSEPINLGPNVNSGSIDACPSISADGLALFFASDRPGGYGDLDIWVTTRPTTDSEWGPPVNYPSLNGPNQDFEPAISPDGSVLYFDSPYAMWQSSITPIVDLNGDGIVDSADMCIIVDYWGTDEPLCDIGPMPWGDGIVDVQDLIILAEHLFEEPSLVIHWPLDEAQGDVAHDSAGTYDGTLIGAPVWQPEGGMVGGALQFDGIDDYVSTDAFRNPANSFLSVFAWIKGGTSGQVIISQKGRSDWLLADTTEGSLMTEMKFAGKSGVPLYSHVVITDGNWHRVGLVLDGSNRILYVDDVEVVSDICDKGMLYGKLQIGAGKNLDPGAFWSGLIDDIRIYNQAVSP